MPTLALRGSRRTLPAAVLVALATLAPPRADASRPPRGTGEAIAILTNDRRALVADRSGRITLAPARRRRPMWFLVRRVGRTVSLRSRYGTFLVATRGGVRAAKTGPGAANARWTLVKAGRSVQLQSRSGKFLAVKPDGTIGLVDAVSEASRLRVRPARPPAKTTPPRRHSRKRPKAPKPPPPPARGARACREDAVPDFPYPAPKPSARMALPSSFLAKTASRPSPRLRHAAEELGALLLDAGYSERSYYRVRLDGRTTGFALVTRIERIERDGTPFPPEKRFLPADAPDQFEVLQFLKSLFVAPVGYYRVLAFVVSNQHLRTEGAPMDSEQAEDLLREGGTRLTGCVARMPFTDDYGIDALIYEFRHAPEEEAGDDQAVSQLVPSKLAPDLHLTKAGLLSAQPKR